MVRRSSVILAATLAVLSTFEPTLCAVGGAHGRSGNEVEKPRFLKKNIRRYVNSTTSATSTFGGDNRGGIPGGNDFSNGFGNGFPFNEADREHSPSPSKSPTITTPSSTQTVPVTTSTHTSSTQTTPSSSSPAIPSTSASSLSTDKDALVQGAVLDRTSPSSSTASSPSSTEAANKTPTTTSSPAGNQNGEGQNAQGNTSPSISLPINFPVDKNVQPGNTSPSSTSSPPPNSSASGGTLDNTSKGDNSNVGLGINSNVGQGGNSNTGQKKQVPTATSATSTNGGNVVNQVVGGLGKGSSPGGGENTATHTSTDQNTGTNVDSNQKTNTVPNSILANVVSTQPSNSETPKSSNRFGGGNDNVIPGGVASNTGGSGGQLTSNPEDTVKQQSNTAANNIPVSVTSGGVLVANPQITPSIPVNDQTKPKTTNGGSGNNGGNGNADNVSSNLDNVNKNVNNLPASVTSNGVLVANPQITYSPSIQEQAQQHSSNGGSGESSDNSGNGVVNNVVNTLDTANKNINNVVASVTSGGVLVPNPQVTGGTNENNPLNANNGIAGDVDEGKSVSNDLVGGANNVKSGLSAALTTIGNVVQDSVVNPGNGGTNDTTNPNENNSPANIPASITSNGQLVSNPLATIPSAANLVNVPASITSGGVLVANPEKSQAAQVLSGLSLPAEAAQVLPSVTSNGVLIPNPSGVVGSETERPGNNDTQNLEGQSVGLIHNVPASITSGGVLVANPAQVTALPQSITLSNGNVVANAALNTALPQSVTLSNGNVVANPALTATNLAEGQESANNTNAIVLPLPQKSGAPVGGSTTLPNGDVVPVSVPSTSPSSPSNLGEFVQKQKGQDSGSAAVPASTTLPNGSVVPVPASTTLPNGSVVPVGASTTLPNGSVVPVGASTTLPNGSVIPVGASTTLPNGSVVPGGASTTLPNGSVVPVASGAQTTGSLASPPAQAGKQENNTAASAVGASGAASNGSQATTTGASEGSSPESKPALTAGPIATTSQAYPSDGKGPFTQQPISYDSNTVQPVASSITYEPSSAPATTGTETVSTGIPSNVPQTIYPPTGPVARPPHCDLIQIAFLYPLNYDFVWIHSESQKQIFTFLPKAIGHCLSIELVNITMQTLKAWDTTQDLHYITTVALAWIPTHLVDTLGLALHTPAGTFYNHPDPSVKTLVSMVNNAVPIRATNETDSGTKTGSEPEATTTGAAPIGGNIGSSSPVQSKSVAIGVGVACGAAAYGAAMFFVARRYKKRKQSHMRSPSMFASPVMSHVGADPAAGQALMSGAMNGERSVSPFYDRAESRGSGRSAGSSGRQQISAPVMAENSLGWN